MSDSTVGTNPFRCGTSGGCTAVSEHLRRLPCVLHPIFTRCKRTLSNEEWHRLQFLTAEQRYAALGMQMEGQHVNSIVAYLLACVENGPPKNGTHSKGSYSSRSAPLAAATVPPHDTASPNGVPEPSQSSTRIGGQAAAAPVHNAASKRDSRSARIAAMVPPRLHHRVDPTETHSLEHPSTRGGSASRGQSMLMAPSPKLVARRLPPGIASVALMKKRVHTPGEGEQAHSAVRSSPSRAVSPIAPPTRAPKLVTQYTSAVSSTVALSVPSNVDVTASSNPLHIDDSGMESLRRIDTGSLAGRKTPHSEDAPIPRTNTCMPRRESRGLAAALLSSPSSARAVLTSPRVPDYQHPVISVPGVSQSRSSPPMLEPHGDTSHVYSASNSLTRLDTSVSSGSGTPRRRLSPERTSRWLVDFQRKLEAVGLDLSAWKGLTAEEQDEFFLYWRMPHLQVSLVRDELR